MTADNLNRSEAITSLTENTSDVLAFRIEFQTPFTFSIEK